MKREAQASVTRYAHNPILTARDVADPDCYAVSNAAAARHNGETVLLVDASMKDGTTRLLVARSPDGITFEISPLPILSNDAGKRYYDPRISLIGSTHYVTFGVDYPDGEVTTGLAATENFEDFEFMGEISEPDSRNTVLFPEKIGGHYLRMNRPFPLYYHWGWPAGTHPAVKEGRTWPSTFNIWMARSPDLVFWGQSQLLLSVRDVPWASHRLGPGAPPIKTEDGWLTIFHGTELTDDGKKIYKLGCMLLGLADPSMIVGLAPDPILIPEMDYEIEGSVPNVVFTCGALPERNGDLRIYYGGADTCICLATARIADLVQLCLAGGAPDRRAGT